jgi:hypothetical protein
VARHGAAEERSGDPADDRTGHSVLRPLFAGFLGEREGGKEGRQGEAGEQVFPLHVLDLSWVTALAAHCRTAKLNCV